MIEKRLEPCIAVPMLFLMLSFLGCAPQESSNAYESKDNEPAVTASWSPESDCTSCHKKEGDSANDEECLYSKHASVSCATCHNDSELTGIHENPSVDMPAKLESTTVGKEICVSCHPMNDLKAATAESAPLVDTKGTTVNPHDLPDVTDHDNIRCSSCHSMHGSLTAASVETAATNKCESCHHAGVYECYTCH